MSIIILATLLITQPDPGDTPVDPGDPPDAVRLVLAKGGGSNCTEEKLYDGVRGSYDGSGAATMISTQFPYPLTFIRLECGIELGHATVVASDIAFVQVVIADNDEAKDFNVQLCLRDYDNDTGNCSDYVSTSGTGQQTLTVYPPDPVRGTAPEWSDRTIGWIKITYDLGDPQSTSSIGAYFLYGVL